MGAAMTLAPGRAGAPSLVSTGKTTAADGFAVLTAVRRALRPGSHHALSRGYNADTPVLLGTLDLRKI
jgi:hypothetical protein